MRKLLAALKQLALVAGAFVLFGVGIPLSYAYVSRQQIVDEDAFFPVCLILGMIFGGIALGLLSRGKKPEGATGFAYVYGLLIIVALTPVAAAFINVKLDFREARTRFGEVIVQTGGNSNCLLPISDWDTPHTFFWLRVKPETYDRLCRGGQIKLTTRPGLLGMEWIEKVHEPECKPYAMPPSSTPEWPAQVEEPE